MARDGIHYAVRRALEKENWTITNDPFYVESGGVSVEIDMEAEKFIAAQKENVKILVEVKPLKNRSLLYDFHSAIGQYIDYQGIINDEKLEQILYLAIPETVYIEMQLKPFYERRLMDNHIKLVVVDIQNENIITWKSY